MVSTEPKFKTVSALKLVEFLFFIGLIITTFFFCEQIIAEYLEGSTYFSATKKSLTKNDLPTVTVCILANTKLEYGRNFNIQTIEYYTWVNNKVDPRTRVITLREGKNRHDFQGPGNTFLKEMAVEQVAAWSRTCLSLEMSVEQEIKANQEYLPLCFFVVKFSDEISKRHDDIQKATLYLTTHQNSYGAAYNRWFDGKIQHFPLQKGGFQTLKIYSVLRYEYLEDTCQHTSFYECLSSKLNSSQYCRENGVQCSSYSLPISKLRQDYPICQTNKTWETCDQYRVNVTSVWDLCMEQKPCQIQEYYVRENRLWTVAGEEENMDETDKMMREFLNERVVDELIKNQTEKYMFWISFLPSGSTRGKYTNQIQIEVSKEYKTLTMISLVGNVGGQLGLFVGFSCTGFIAWTLSLVPKIQGMIVRMVNLH